MRNGRRALQAGQKILAKYGRCAVGIDKELVGQRLAIGSDRSTALTLSWIPAKLIAHTGTGRGIRIGEEAEHCPQPRVGLSTQGIAAAGQLQVQVEARCAGTGPCIGALPASVQVSGIAVNC